MIEDDKHLGKAVILGWRKATFNSISNINDSNHSLPTFRHHPPRPSFSSSDEMFYLQSGARSLMPRKGNKYQISSLSLALQLQKPASSGPKVITRNNIPNLHRRSRIVKSFVNGVRGRSSRENEGYKSMYL